jgi:hypothetical protein
MQGGGRWGICVGVSANEYSYARGAQISYGDLTSYLTYDAIPAPEEMGREGRERGRGRLNFVTQSINSDNNSNGSSWESH